MGEIMANVVDSRDASWVPRSSEDQIDLGKS